MVKNLTEHIFVFGAIIMITQVGVVSIFSENTSCIKKYSEISAIIETNQLDSIIISNPVPENDSSNIPLQPKCSITVNHSQGYGLTVEWFENSTGSWLLCQINQSTSWYHPCWKYRKLISINHTKIQEPLSNFPLLVALVNDSNLTSNAQPDGDDICFIDYADNITKLNHEIELYNGTSGTLYAWVNIPFINNVTNTNIWMYYGNPQSQNQQNIAETWNQNYKAVWHLSDIAGIIVDSTENSQDLIAMGSPQLNVSGKIGKCIDFVPIDYLDSGSLIWFDYPTVTVEAWVHSDTPMVADQRIIASGANNDNKWVFVWDSTIDNLHRGIVMTYGTPTTVGNNRHISGTYNSVNWHHVVGVRTTTNAVVYVNGTNVTGIGEDSFSLDGDGKIATKSSTQFGFDGKIDEVRISNVERNGSWINASYLTTNDPSTFFTINNEESVSSNGTYHWVYTQANELNQKYYWKVLVTDMFDTYTSVYHFTTLPAPNQPPYSPSFPSPLNNSINISLNADLYWVGGDPDPGDSVYYDVYFGTENPPPIIVYNLSALTYDPGLLEINMSYYWKILARDNHGDCTMGPPWFFTTLNIPNQPPNKPYNPIPVNGSYEIPIHTDLSWVCNDPDSGDSIVYDVFFGTFFPLTKIKSNISGTSCFLDNLTYNSKYYWKVVAWDNHRNSNESPFWEFTTRNDTAPPSIRIDSPNKGYLYINFGNVIITKVPIFLTTLIIGQIEVTATISDSQSGVDYVEFYLDDELQATVTTIPYTWEWTERGYFFPYRLKVIAYDTVGNHISTEMKVWKIL